MKKKTVFLAAALALLPGTVLAANPFSDVPREHWAYDAIEQLAADGIIEGYGDGTYRGEKAITRYEMAQMVARAMARGAEGYDKSLIDKLAAEFAQELESLGVRVERLEKNADNVKWEGMMRLRRISQWHRSGEKTVRRDAGYLTLRLEPSMEITKNVSAHARIDYNLNLSDDVEVDGATFGTSGRELIPPSGLKRLWVQYDGKGFQAKAGKIPYLSVIDRGMIYDESLSGVQVTAGKKIKATATLGRTRRFDAIYDLPMVYANDPTVTAGDYHSLELYNDRQARFTWGLAYHHWKSRDKTYEENGATSISIYEAGLGYRFDKNLSLNGAFAWTNSPDMEHEPGEVPDTVNSKTKWAFSIELDYKKAQPKDKGSFGLFLAYRQLGHYAVIAPTYDIIGHGLRGLEVGGDYVFAPNMVGTLRYFHGKKMPDEAGPGERLESAKGFLGELCCYF